MCRSSCVLAMVSSASGGNTLQTYCTLMSGIERPDGGAVVGQAGVERLVDERRTEQEAPHGLATMVAAASRTGRGQRGRPRRAGIFG
jgi:hypothetical protein